MTHYITSDQSNRPQPVLQTAQITALIRYVILAAGLVGAHAWADWLSDRATVIALIVGAVVETITTIRGALIARGKVTPKEHPQDDDGMPLVRADSAALRPVVLQQQQAVVEPTDDGAMVVEDPGNGVL